MERVKATAELAERLDYVDSEIDRMKDDDHRFYEAKYQELCREYHDLVFNYDWYDVVFEENGKKGMKNVKVRL